MSRGYTDYRNDNPYAQQDAGSGYGQGGYGGNQGGYNGNQNPYGNNNAYEMGNVGNTQDQLLNDVREIDETILDLERRRLPELERLYQSYFNAIDEQATAQVQRTIDTRVADISQVNQAMVERLRRLKGKYGDDVQVKRMNGKVDKVLKDYRAMEHQFSRKVRDQMERQYRVVNPNAGEDEVQEFLETGQSQVFSQAVMSGQRSRQAESVLQNAQARHNEIQRIERTMVELAQLFQQMNEQIIEQEAKVEVIDTQADEARVNVEAGQEQMVEATNKARAARRKKWWCLLIVVIIIVVIGVILAIVFTRNNGGGSKRRSLEYLVPRAVEAVEGTGIHRRANLQPMRVRRSNFIA